MAAKRSCRTLLLPDTPASKDEFGAHERLARVIENLVTTEDGGKSIGIDGGYGSGKSTVIKLLCNKLSSNPNLTVVLFDAWAHEDDPLRRTFLEKLIRHLQREKWINETEWDNRREELTRRRKITDKRVIPTLGVWGKVLAVSLLLIPIGLALFNSGLRDGLSFRFSQGAAINLLAVIGLLLAINPLITYLLLQIIWYLDEKASASFKSQMRAVIPDKIYKKISPPYKALKESRSVWERLLAQKVVSDERTETIENPEPTSVEFEHIFFELMGEALADPSRRIILVLDNLDRSTSKDVRSLLSTLQTFLQQSEHNFDSWFDQVWILIPFDRSGLSHLWASTNNEINGSQKMAIAFLDKSFQIRFDVPPLLVSDWHSYLQELLKKAFPDHDDNEFHSVYRVYDTYRRQKGISPTPRNLKIFVNQVGAIHRLWEDKYPLYQLAYYVLLKREGENIAEKLIQGELPEQEFKGIVGSNVTENLAALTFGVEVAVAQQLLLKNPLSDALGQGDIKELRRLAEFQGFEQVLETISFDNWAKVETIKLAAAAKSLNDSGLLNSVPSSVKTTIIHSMIDVARQVKKWSPLNKKMAAGIITLIDFSKDTSFVKQVIADLSETNVSDHADEVGADINNWVDGYIEILKYLQGTQIVPFEKTKVVIPISAKGYFEACAQLVQQDAAGVFWSHLLPKANNDEFASAISVAIADGTFSDKHVSAIKVLKRVRQLSWSQLATTMTSNIQGATNHQPSFINALSEALYELQGIERNVNTQINALAQQGIILHHLFNVRSDAQATAWCLYFQLKQNPAMNVSPGIGNSTAGHQFVTTQLFVNPDTYHAISISFIALLEKTQDLHLLFDILDKNPASKLWIIACLKMIAQSSNALTLFTPQVVWDRWDLICENFDEECDLLLANLLSQTELLDLLKSRDFDRNKAGLYASIIQVSNPIDPGFLDWCLNNLSSVETGVWSEELSNEGCLVELVLSLVKMDVKVNLSVNFKDALVLHAEQAMVGNVTLQTISITDWRLLPYALSKASQRKTLRMSLLEATEAKGGNIHELFFDLYEEEISDIEVIKNDSRVVSRFFSPLVTQSNARGLQWLASLFSDNNTLLRKLTPKESVADFEERLQLAVSESNALVAQYISQIIDSVGISTHDTKTVAD